MKVTERSAQCSPNARQLYAPSPTIQISRSGSHRCTALTICSAHMALVLCRLPAARLKAGVVESTTRKGTAQHWVVQDGVTTTAITIQRNPLLLTARFRVESALSRKFPRL